MSRSRIQHASRWSRLRFVVGPLCGLWHATAGATSVLDPAAPSAKDGAPPSGIAADPVELPELPEPDDVADESNDAEAELSAADQAVAELSQHTRAPIDTSAAPRLREPRMSAVGVHDPFPDHARRQHPAAPAAFLSVGLGLAGASLAMAHLSLMPDCGDASDVRTCAVPDGADIGVRGGRLLAAVSFGVGGAMFGTLGGRALGYRLQDGPSATLTRRRGLAVGVGSSALALGVAGVVVGATVFGVYGRRAVAVGNTVEGEGSTLGADDMAKLDQTLDHVRTARGGLMVLVASPTLVAAGIALLATRPRTRNVRMRPTLGRTQFGVSVSGQF